MGIPNLEAIAVRSRMSILWSLLTSPASRVTVATVVVLPVLDYPSYEGDPDLNYE